MLTTEDLSPTMEQYLNMMTREALIELMFNALDEMQSYNGRSRKECIHLALGSKEIENGWSFPTLERVAVPARRRPEAPFMKVLADLTRWAECQQCEHDETERQGHIWTKCLQRGKSAADDEGGLQPDPIPKQVAAARALLDQLS